MMVEGPPFDPCAGSVRVGLQTDDDFRFVRLFWEHEVPIARAQRRWRPLLKGEKASRYYGDVVTMLAWSDEARELKAHVTVVLSGGHWSRHVFNTEFYGRPGISWALRTAGFAPSVVPSGCVPTVSR